MGRDWTYRGNVIEGSRFASIGPSIWGPVTAVYLDDQLSSVAVRRTTFDHHDGMILELGGGRHNEFTENVLNGSTGFIHFDNRGGDGNGCARPGHLPFDFLHRVPYNCSSCSWTKYPGLAGILSDASCALWYNVLANSVLCGGTSLIGLDPAKIEATAGLVLRSVLPA